MSAGNGVRRIYCCWGHRFVDLDAVSLQLVIEEQGVLQEGKNYVPSRLFTGLWLHFKPDGTRFA